MGSNKTLMKIGICIPTREQWRADFGQCLTMMVADFVSQQYENFEIGIKLCNSKGSILPQQRADMVRECLASGCSHLLFLDDDMAFPMTALYDLLAADKDIVAANCVTKTIPPTPTARDIHNNRIPINDQLTGLQEVGSVGCAVMLVKADVFKKLPKPWFNFEYRPSKDDFVGEDVFFCWKSREHGFKVYIDHDLSRKVLHIGDFHYHYKMLQPEEKKNGLLIA